MSERKLCYKVTIDEIRPIMVTEKDEDGNDVTKEATSIALARTTGWEAVVSKGEFKVGDTALFFEIDSALNPHDDRFAFLRDRCYKRFLDSSRNLFDECLRIRTMKLKGVISQGLLLPVAQFCEVRNKKLGDDCSDVLMVRHYDDVATRAMREQAPFIAANAKGVFPDGYGPKSDEPRVQNITDVELSKMIADKVVFEVTEKLDGTSVTIGYGPSVRPDDPIAVCSRNLELKETPPSAYWDAVHDLGLVPKLMAWCTDNKREITIQGELVGPGIQENRDHRDKRSLNVFRIWDIVAKRWVPAKERYKIVKDLGLDHVPVLEETTLEKFQELGSPDNMQSVRKGILAYADGTTERGNRREGVVFKAVNGDIHFKAVSNLYLLGLK